LRGQSGAKRPSSRPWRSPESWKRPWNSDRCSSTLAASGISRRLWRTVECGASERIVSRAPQSPRWIPAVGHNPPLGPWAGYCREPWWVQPLPCVATEPMFRWRRAPESVPWRLRLTAAARVRNTAPN